MRCRVTKMYIHPAYFFAGRCSAKIFGCARRQAGYPPPPLRSGMRCIILIHSVPLKLILSVVVLCRAPPTPLRNVTPGRQNGTSTRRTFSLAPPGENFWRDLPAGWVPPPPLRSGMRCIILIHSTPLKLVLSVVVLYRAPHAPLRNAVPGHQNVHPPGVLFRRAMLGENFWLCSPAGRVPPPPPSVGDEMYHFDTFCPSEIGPKLRDIVSSAPHPVAQCSAG